MTIHYEKLTFASGFVLVAVLCFLTENTAHSVFRLTAAGLLLLAFIVAAWGWIASAPHGYGRWPWLRHVSVVLLSVALLAATVGYAVTSAAGRNTTEPVGASDEGVQATDPALSDTYALATTTAIADTTSSTDTTSTTTVVTTTEMPTATTTEGSTTTLIPDPPPDKSNAWAGVSLLFGVGAFLAFLLSIILSGTGASRTAVNASRIAGAAMALASMGTHTWKLLDVDSLIKKLEVRIALQRGGPKPQTPNTQLALLCHQPVGPFKPGEALLDDNMRNAIRKGLSAADQQGEISFAILVGHVDRRALLPDTATEYASNQGLAHRRALAVQNALGVPSVVTVGGPSHTNRDATPAQLDDDRRVDVYFWGRRK